MGPTNRWPKTAILVLGLLLAAGAVYGAFWQAYLSTSAPRPAERQSPTSVPATSSAGVSSTPTTTVETLTPTTQPTISGVARVGMTLTADAGAWGPPPVELAYQWYRSEIPIPDAAESAYELVADDVDHTIRVRVTGSKPGYPRVQLESAPTGEVVPGVLSPAPVPTIAGVAQVGAELTAVPGTWGPPLVELGYQWYRAGTPIPGATASRYAPGSDDLGAAITVRVTGSLAGHTSSWRESAPSVAVAPGVLSPAPVPTIDGSAKVGQRLRAVTGAWGPAPVALTYAWYRRGVAIPGASESSYLLQATDAGTTIKVRVTGTKPGYASTARDSVSTAAVQPGTFTAAPAPTISGTLRVGQTLDGGVTWTPAPVAMTYQWFRNGVAISGATNPTYRLVVSDLGASMSVSVTGTKTGYATQSKSSGSSAAVQPGILDPTPTPTITGTPRVGNWLQANSGTWGPAPVTLSYQWLRDEVAVNGATSSSYKLSRDDVGATMRVRVTGSKAGYVTTSRTSAPTVEVRRSVLRD